MHTLFVYGTLKRGFNNNRLLDQATFIGQDTIKGRMYSLGGFPCVSLSQDGEVHGELFSVNDETLARCDRLEGFYGPNENNFYDRSEVATSNGVKTWVYHIDQGNDGRRVIESGVWS